MSEITQGSTVIVEGSLSLAIDSGDESDSSDEDSVVFEENEYFVDVAGHQDSETDEEELEIFSSSGTASTSSRKVKPKKSRVSSNTTEEEPANPLLKAMSAAVETVLASNIDDETFGIKYKPFKKPQESKQLVTFEDEADFERELSIPVKSAASTSENDNTIDEFEFEDVSDSNNTQALDIILSKGVIHEDLTIENEIPVDSDVSKEVISNNNIVSSENTEKKSILVAAKQALDDIKNIYHDGLGDIEVRMLDMSEADNEDSKKPIFPTVGASKSVISEVIEEGDEEAEEEEEKQKEISHLQQSMATTELQDAWESINDDPSSRKDLSEEDSFESLWTDIDYEAAVKYFLNEDLSQYSSQIVTKDGADNGGMLSWWPGSSQLNFPDHEKLLEFPFLVAQVDFQPDNLQHLGMLRHIYKTLALDQQLPKASPSCPAKGPHWDQIGFQGIDPCTDINRSMKMFAVLQMLHFVDYYPKLALELHKLSLQKDEFNGKVFDQSWPFMCVSIMFTKEAIQGLRKGGTFYQKCNKRKTVLSVLHDFHHGCFLEFKSRLEENSKVHHAEHLSKIRELCSTKPVHIFSIFKKYRTDNMSTKQIPETASLSHGNPSTSKPRKSLISSFGFPSNASSSTSKSASRNNKGGSSFDSELSFSSVTSSSTTTSSSAAVPKLKKFDELSHIMENERVEDNSTGRGGTFLGFGSKASKFQVKEDEN